MIELLNESEQPLHAATLNLTVEPPSVYHSGCDSSYHIISMSP